MSDFTLYETATGKIIGILSMTVDNEQIVDPGYAYVAGNHAGKKYWIDDGVARLRPVLPVHIQIDGSTCTLTGMPAGTSVEINGVPVYTVTESGAFTYQGDGSYAVTLINFPMRERHIMVEN